MRKAELLMECSQLLQIKGVDTRQREMLCRYLDYACDGDADYYGRFRAAVCFLEDCDIIDPDSSDMLLTASHKAFFKEEVNG